MGEKMNKHRRPIHILAVPAILGIISLATMLLWNGLMPDIFGLQEINFWQALGILVLSKILFGGFFQNMHGRNGLKHQHRNIRDKWHNMSKEEKEEFENRMHNRFHQMRGEIIDIAEDIHNNSQSDDTTQNKG
jgi:hypothetical protein